jgi:YD repeat-containing protein
MSGRRHRHSPEAHPLGRKTTKEYDAAGNLVKLTDPAGRTTTYTYGQLDRLTETENGHKEVVKYECDLAGDQTKTTYPNGKAVTRAFDKDGRLEKVTDWNGKGTKFSYDPDSDLTATVFPSETKDEDKYAYNDPGRNERSEDAQRHRNARVARLRS